jgi:hypothetical protein
VATLSFDSTAKVATVDLPDESITIQEVYDQFVRWESRAHEMAHSRTIIGGGKFDYGTGDLTVVSIRLLDWKLAFAARPGPSWVECQVTGGNLSAVDDVGAATAPVQGTDYVTVQYAQATTGALIQVDEVVDIWTRPFGGRLYVDDATAEEVIRDALGTVYSKAKIWSDDGTTPYDGTAGVARRDEHVKP